MLLQLRKDHRPQRRREEEIKKEEADRQYKLTPDGLYDGITTLLSKTNLNVDKDAITIRVKKHLYNKIENSVNEIKDKVNCELYIEEFNDFNDKFDFIIDFFSYYKITHENLIPTCNLIQAISVEYIRSLHKYEYPI